MWNISKICHWRPNLIFRCLSATTVIFFVKILKPLNPYIQEPMFNILEGLWRHIFYMIKGVERTNESWWPTGYLDMDMKCVYMSKINNKHFRTSNKQRYLVPNYYETTDTNTYTYTFIHRKHLKIIQISGPSRETNPRPQQLRTLPLHLRGSHVLKKVSRFKVDVYKSSGPPKQKWMDCMREDMEGSKQWTDVW